MPSRNTVLIYGGAGFIGSFLCERLLRDSNVICVDNFVSSGPNNINQLLKSPNFVLLNHDFNKPLDLETIREVSHFQIDVFGVQEVYNFACPTSVKNFEKLKVDTCLASTVGLINSLDLAVKYNAKYLFASSSVVYGNVARGQFVDERHVGALDPVDPRACYDLGKTYAEAVVRAYREKYGIDTKVARIFRTFGPRMLINDGQMIPDFIVNALDGKDLTIYGDENFQTSLCFVGDIVEGCIKLMATDLNDPVNLGSTFVYKLVDVANKIIELTESNSRIQFGEAKSFMRELALPDISLIKESAGWFPIVTLDEGLRKTVDFTRAHKDLLNFSEEILQ